MVQVSTTTSEDASPVVEISGRGSQIAFWQRVCKEFLNAIGHSKLKSASPMRPVADQGYSAEPDSPFQSR